MGKKASREGMKDAGGETVHGAICNPGFLKVKLQGGCWMHLGETANKQKHSQEVKSLG